jgi:hypothetical protein
MEIKAAFELKENAEEQIFNILFGLELATGLRVADLKIGRREIIGKQPPGEIYAVKLKLEL